MAIFASALTPDHFLKGLILGLVLAAVPGLLWSLTLQATGTAPTMMGDEAEQWTAQELRKLKRRGWRLVNHDHARQQERVAVDQAWSNARSMTLWSELRTCGVAVQPLVVLWGGGARGWHEDQRIRTIDGVPVVTGPAINNWVRTLPSDLLDATAAKKVWSIIATQASARDERDRAENAVPPSAMDYAARLCRDPGAGCGSAAGAASAVRGSGLDRRNHPYTVRNFRLGSAREAVLSGRCSCPDARSGTSGAQASARIPPRYLLRTQMGWIGVGGGQPPHPPGYSLQTRRA